MRVAAGFEDNDWAYDFVVRWLTGKWRVPPEDVNLDLPLFLVDGTLDSLDYAELIMDLEDQCPGLRLPEAPPSIETLRDLVRWIRSGRPET